MFLSVRSYNFRNLVNQTLSTEAKNIYLIGENGQGKSNFLELIYLLCFGGSFRTHQDELLITQGKNDMMVEGSFLDKNSQQNTISCKLEKEKKEIRQNGKVVADRKDLIENIPCIVFKHEDIYFVNGSPERRRLFFNQVMGIYDIQFLEKLREYAKILRMRNASLKDRKLDFLPVLDRQLAAAGLDLVARRRAVTQEFSPLFSDVFTTGVLPIYLGIALVMGENIGTTATANLAALGANMQARRAALAHLLFNVFGVIWVLCVFYPFVDIVCGFVGYDPSMAGQTERMPVVLAMFHTCFNVTNTALLIGLVPQMERWFSLTCSKKRAISISMRSV